MEEKIKKRKEEILKWTYEDLNLWFKTVSKNYKFDLPEGFDQKLKEFKMKGKNLLNLDRKTLENDLGIFGSFKRNEILREIHPISIWTVEEVETWFKEMCKKKNIDIPENLSKYLELEDLNGRELFKMDDKMFKEHLTHLNITNQYINLDFVCNFINLKENLHHINPITKEKQDFQNDLRKKLKEEMIYKLNKAKEMNQDNIKFFEKFYEHLSWELDSNLFTLFDGDMMLKFWEDDINEIIKGKLSSITNLKWKKIFKKENLPLFCEDNSSFILSILLVEEFLSNQVSVGCYRKHNDGFDADPKENNDDIIKEFQQKPPNIRISFKKLQNELRTCYGWCDSKKGVDDIFINEKLYHNSSRASTNDEICKYAFLLSIVILHEISHYKIRNFHGENNLKDSPEKFNESGWFFEKHIFGDSFLFHEGLDWNVENLLIQKEGSRIHLFNVDSFKSWFDLNFWKDLKSIEHLKFDVESLPFYEKKIEKLDRDILIFTSKQPSILFLKCGAHLRKDKLEKVLFK